MCVLGLVKSLASASTIIATSLMMTGCQQITEVEFYPPSKDTESYCTKATGTTPGRGPIKRVKGKSGSPDFSDNKSFTLTLFNL